MCYRLLLRSETAAGSVLGEKLSRLCSCKSVSVITFIMVPTTTLLSHSCVLLTQPKLFVIAGCMTTTQHLFANTFTRVRKHYFEDTNVEIEAREN